MTYVAVNFYCTYILINFYKVLKTNLFFNLQKKFFSWFLIHDEILKYLRKHEKISRKIL